jgi:hypothetical protein
MATIELTADDEAKVEEFAGNLFMACLATMELANVELGVRLGLGFDDVDMLAVEHPQFVLYRLS